MYSDLPDDDIAPHHDQMTDETRYHDHDNDHDTGVHGTDDDDPLVGDDHVVSVPRRPTFWFVLSFVASLIIVSILFRVSSSHRQAPVTPPPQTTNNNNNNVPAAETNNLTKQEPPQNATALPLTPAIPNTTVPPVVLHNKTAAPTLAPTIQNKTTVQPTGKPTVKPTVAPTAPPTTDTTATATFTCSTSDYQLLLQNLSNHSEYRCETNNSSSTNGTTAAAVVAVSCKCLDPTIPINRGRNIRGWSAAFQRNKLMADNASSTLQASSSSPAGTSSKLDVLMLGDSIMERWLGTLKGGKIIYPDIHQLYQALFQSPPPASNVSGLALGIAGDRAPHLLWRVENGEYPTLLPVQVAWILIGTNDLNLDYCSSDAVVAGTVAIVEQILATQKPDRVVINSLLPHDELMDQVVQVNQRMQCYAQSREPVVEFFDATGLFSLSTSSSNSSNSTPPAPSIQQQPQQNLALFESDKVHPNLDGFRVFGNAIVQRVQEIKLHLDGNNNQTSSTQTNIKDEEMSNNTTVTNTTITIEPPPQVSNNTGPSSTSTCDSNLDYYNSSLQNLSQHVELRCEDKTVGHKCFCLDPATPLNADRMVRGWNVTFTRNIKLVQDVMTNGGGKVDVLMLGDSMFEHWLGTQRSGKMLYRNINNMYQELFRSESSQVSGLALGIAGDQSPFLLYRVAHGEYPATLQVNTVWISIGMNDMFASHCNPETVVAGNVAIVEEILASRTPYRVVINSMFPHDATQAMVDQVNHQLECYAQTRAPAVVFFDATSLFSTVNETTTQQHQNLSLFDQDQVHPNYDGYRIFGNAIVQRVQEFKAEFKGNTPP